MDRPPNLPTESDVRRFEEEVLGCFKAIAKEADSHAENRPWSPSLSVLDVELVDSFPQTAIRVRIEDRVAQTVRPWRRLPFWTSPETYRPDGSTHSAERVASDLVMYAYGG